MKRVKLSSSVLRKVSVMAGCDPRTVAAFCEGRELRGSLSIRVREALARLRIEVHVEVISSEVTEVVSECSSDTTREKPTEPSDP